MGYCQFLVELNDAHDKILQSGHTLRTLPLSSGLIAEVLEASDTLGDFICSSGQDR